MNTVTQAIIPQLGEPLKSSHLYSFAEAFNSRILSGAGDSHWRIPYYIFSTYFRKPRLDDNMLYTPESEFFDFYQFVNPSTGETWPTNPPQEPEGANLQTNFLNRFIFGMNYQTKDIDGNWLYEREDVRVQKGQDKIKNDPSSFRGFVFPFFTSIGTETGSDGKYTSFGLSSEIYSNGYISGLPTNPQGNSFGGYYGKNPLIISSDGCGTNAGTLYPFPLSQSSVIKIDGARDGDFYLYSVCNEGVGDQNQPDQYSIINDGNPNSILAFTIKNKTPIDVDVFPKNKFHLSQFQSTVFFGRESKNHIHRLLYNYITYAKGFDFDWFFNNQYSYAPEIGSFVNMISIYDKNPDAYYGRLNLLDTQIQISPARLTLQKTGLSASRINNGTFNQDGTTAVTITFTSSHSYEIGDYIFISFYSSSGILLQSPIEGYYFITGKTSNSITVQAPSSNTISGIVDIRNFLPITDGYLSKVISDSAYIQTKYYNYPTNNNALITKETISGASSVFNYLLNNDFLAKGWEYLLSSPYLYSYDANNPDKVVVPLGFALNNIKVISSTLKKFTLTVHYYVNDVYVSYRDIQFEYTDIIKPGNEISSSISGDIFLATTTPEIVYSVKFEIRDIEILSGHSTASIILNPIFLFAYKPKIEDAYALLRVCTYYGTKDGNFDDNQHPLNRASYYSDQLKKYGVLGNGDIPKTEGDMHSPLSFELNNNALYEASRRLSLYTRIIKPDNFIGIKAGTDNTLIFKRYAMQSGRSALTNSKEIVYGPSTSLSAAFNIFGIDDNVNNCIPYINNYKIWNATLFTEGYSFYYSGFKRYDFIFPGESDKISSRLSIDLVASLATKVNNSQYPTRVNNNNVSFTPTSYGFDYDALLQSVNGNILYFQFEDEYGVKFNDGDENSPQYYAKVYTSPNPSETFEKRYLDANSNIITLTETDLNFLKADGKPKFYLYIFNRKPNENSLRNSDDSGRQFYHVDKNGAFIQRVNNDAWRFNYSGYKAVKMSVSGKPNKDTLPDEAIYNYLTYPDKTPINDINNIQSQDSFTEYTLTINKLMDLANILYNNYKSSDIQLNNSDGTVSYVSNSEFNNFTSFSVDDYNKYLAGYKIKISAFKNHSDNNQLFDSSYEIAPTIVIFEKLNSSNIVLSSFSYPIDSDIPLPTLENGEYFKIKITVNNRVDKISKSKVNLDFYLAIINAVLVDEDPILETINRDGGAFISRSANLIIADNSLPTARDMFQGIAPKAGNILSGSLLINQEYKVSGGVILHDGKNYGTGYSSTFIATTTQYTVSSIEIPLVTQINGIIEIAPPSSFTNEWAFWINFLPYSGSPTSSFKEEVYGATNSPFIDRCHVNSKLIAKSTENSYFNLGLPKTYIPEMPPSYRYVPLLTKNGLVYENLVGDSNIKTKFYAGCKAFMPPYKIKKAYLSSSDNYENVYIELNRSIDGFNSNYSSNPNETFRTDYNGLMDWISRGSGFGIRSFRIGDASITNDSGTNQATSNTANGYQGSYYPRFFFVKLIPKPYSDKNDTNDDLKDSPTNHDMIKQGELYLEAMREGFTADASGSRGKLSCANIKGHLTPPDYKYDQLFMNATSTSEYFGNKYPSLLTSSINFNAAALRSEDNPRGFGAIPFVGTYLEPYAAIAKSINSLTKFRVPFPLNFSATQYSYGITELLATNDWNDATYTRLVGLAGPNWANFNSPSSVSDITNLTPVITNYNLRNSGGGLIGVSATQGYAIQDLADDTQGVNLGNARINKYYSSVVLNLSGIDEDLKNIAYYNIKTILPTKYSASVFVEKSSKITKLVQTRLPSENNCGRYYSSGSGENLAYFYLKTIYSDPISSCETIFGNNIINPGSLQTGKPFYRVIETQNCTVNNEPATESFQRSSFFSDSTTTYTIFESGFQIVQLNTEDLKRGDVT